MRILALIAFTACGPAFTGADVLSDGSSSAPPPESVPAVPSSARPNDGGGSEASLEIERDASIDASFDAETNEAASETPEAASCDLSCMQACHQQNDDLVACCRLDGSCGCTVLVGTCF